mgnify:CR=1 FL=1
MADIVSIHATSHTPVMINFPGAIPDEDRERIFAGFRQVGEEIRQARPDAVVVVGDVNSTLACSIVAKKLGIAVLGE